MIVHILVAAPLAAIVGVVHKKLYRKRFLPTVTDADLDRLARNPWAKSLGKWHRNTNP
jgi:hypothetical protein